MQKHYYARFLKRLKLKKNSRLIIFAAFYSIALLTIGMIIGILSTKKQEGKVYDVKNTPKLEQVGSIGAISILPNTEISLYYIFTECEHSYLPNENDIADLTRSLIGMTKSQIENNIKNCTVVELTQKKAVIEIKVTEFCPKHYILIATDEHTLSIFHTDEATLICEQISEIGFDIERVSSDVAKLLEAGIPFDDIRELDSYVEGLET